MEACDYCPEDAATPLSLASWEGAQVVVTVGIDYDLVVASAGGGREGMTISPW